MGSEERIRWEGTYGKVRGECGMFDDCCAVTIFSMLTFYPDTHTKAGYNKLYKEFMLAVLDRDFGCSDDFEERVCKILIADFVGGKEYNFCMATEEHWEVGEPALNPKTDRMIQIFELTLPKCTKAQMHDRWG